MANEMLIDLRRTQLLAVDTSLDDARRALLRAARIPSVFAPELRSLLAAVADLERRVLANAKGDGAGLAPAALEAVPLPPVPEQADREPAADPQGTPAAPAHESP
jgi:hypothetical protein